MMTISQRVCCTVNPARFSAWSFFDSQLKDSSFYMFQKLPCVFTQGEQENIFILSLRQPGTHLLGGEKRKSRLEHNLPFFFSPRTFPRDFYSFLVSRHVLGVSPMMKVGCHSQYLLPLQIFRLKKSSALQPKIALHTEKNYMVFHSFVFNILQPETCARLGQYPLKNDPRCKVYQWRSYNFLFDEEYPLG